MVSILPQKTNLGSQVGQSLGAGLSQGMQQGLQRGMLQQALSKIGNLDQSGASPLQALTTLMEATAGIPGSERYVGALAPLILGNLRTKKLYGEGSGQGTLSDIDQGAPMAKTPADASKIASKFISGGKPEGFLASPMNPDQMQEYASEYARSLNDPQAFDRGFAQAQAINESRIQSRQALQQAALEQGIKPDEMPRFMQFATDVQGTNDIPTITRAATDQLKKLRNQKDALKNINAPGVYQNLGGLKQHFIPGMTLTKALTSHGKVRQKALKGYSEAVKNLVDQGEEVFVRSTLAEQGLSPTEVEELIHPLSENVSASIGKLPKGDQLNPKARKESLINFLKSNVGNDTSLLVVRDNLINQKGYDWEEFLDAVNTAFPKAQNLNEYQKAELSSIAQPPIQSLSQIFGPTPNIRGFLRGQK